ncbi:triose-phosphate isomerase [Brachybacterium sp. p3-SID957]|uniref:triose-phosphate isomerase n=1 Tax=Brachybacterium sp. p3-SID957 TaxID=2916049 RepID=UPI00223C133E|nr:triose-phosphate isomerase [Brachybacterium sp. p3-SID957]MCT1776496.1 triose-phosphate isomerase [Brachybacterium sp. p3-SID957]
MAHAPAGSSSAPAVWIGTSWKMNKTLAQARAWAEGLRDHLGGRAPDGVQPFVIPSFTATTTVAEVLGPDSPVLLGVQNAHWEDAGAWTGEVSVPQAKDAGAQLVEIGHSERREHFGETVETTRLKVAAALRHGLTPLLCIGESLEVKERGGSAAFILEQAAGALEGLDDSALSRVLIAYEPIWAIGERGRPAEVDELLEPFAALGEACTGKVAGLLYGGSVNLENAAGLLGIEHVSGLFVGRTAWQLEGYLQLLNIAEAHLAA